MNGQIAKKIRRETTINAKEAIGVVMKSVMALPLRSRLLFAWKIVVRR